MTLVEAKDPMKDQSYYLYRLSQKQLSLALFPLGTLTKDEVFAHAKRFKIPLERPSYRESQDLCFFPDASLNDFLSRYLREKPGPIKTLEGKTIGTHRGLPFYTIGQRRGLKVGGQSIPLYVVKKEQKSNTIFMASCRDNVENYARISSITFPSTPPAMNRRIPCEARIRSQGEKYHGSFIYRSLKGSFEFNSPVRNLTPGQSLVLYHGKEIIGGGIIEPKNAR
jgi:tRNA-specific 2-thiouridylase